MIKMYPCARYHAHMEDMNAELRAAGDPPLDADTSFCAYACGFHPVVLEVQDADEKFWSCPCAVARAMRDAKQHEEALWDTAENHSVHLARVRALIELADLKCPPEGGRH
jgi:hypothetical protein